MSNEPIGLNLKFSVSYLLIPSHPGGLDSVASAATDNLFL